MGKYYYTFYREREPQWFLDAVDRGDIFVSEFALGLYEAWHPYCEIKTPEGIIRADSGDDVFICPNGRIYVYENEVKYGNN